MNPPEPVEALRQAAPRTARRASAGIALLLVILAGLTMAGTGADGSVPPTPDTLRLKLDPNVASHDELMLLPGIGPALAGYIVEFREAAAPERVFDRPADLELVHRIGPVTVERMRPYLRFTPPAGK